MSEDNSYIQFTASDATRANGAYYQREYYTNSKHVNACKLRLKRFITDHPEQTFLIYQVPMVVIGSALRDAKTVLNHIIHSLRNDGFCAEYLGSNLLFISWNAAASNDRQKVKDYVEQAQLGFDPRRRIRRPAAPTVVPLTKENLVRNGPGPPLPVSDNDRIKARMNREIQQRLQIYANDNSSSNLQRRAIYDRVTSHEDAMRNVANRTIL